MQSVKYSCKKCGHSEKPKLLEKIGYVFKEAFATIGLLTVFMLVAVLVFFGPSPIVSFADEAVSRSVDQFAKSHDDQLREAALNLTSACDGADSFCYTVELYNSLMSLRYVPPSKYKILYAPEYVLDNGGDCKNTASMTVALLGSIGFDAKVDCSVEHAHCIALVPRKLAYEHEYSEVMIVDLAQQKFEVISRDTDPWSLYD
jgi:hypothetical protein